MRHSTALQLEESRGKTVAVHDAGRHFVGLTTDHRQRLGAHDDGRLPHGGR